MLFSLIKILAFVAIVTGLTFGAIYLTDLSGGAQITMAGYEVTLTPLQLVIGFVVLVLLIWIGLKILGFLVALLRFINGDETAISRFFTRNRERRGFNALAEGMMALASGEGQVALAKAQRADRYLDRPELTTLLTAQAADMAGNRDKAAEAYRKLVEDDRTRFVGIRGILQHKLADGDTETALKLAERAFALKPAHQETQDILLRLQAESSDWAGARATLGAKLKHGTLPKNVFKRRDAVLALSEARDVLDEGRTVDAREEAIEANRLSPDLIPAAVMAARGYIEKGNARYATRILKKAWEVQPHPDLAAAFAEIVPNETPEERKRRFTALTRIRPEDAETRMLLAELEIAAEDFPAARRALGDLVETEPTARNLTLMAAIERGMGAGEPVVRGWLARALAAPRGPQWVCDNCNHVPGAWNPVCPNCHALDTLSWRSPPEGETSLPGGVEMLPLLVGGAVAPDAAEEVVEAEETAITLPAEAEESDTQEETPEPVEEEAK